MRLLHLLFGFGGRLGKARFAIAFAAVVAGFWIARQLALASLPWLGSFFGPRGINGGFVLNGILTVLWFLGTWMVLALTGKRLHDRGHSGWWAAAAVLPLVALVMLNDEIVLVSTKFALPPLVEKTVLVASAALGLWVLVQCLFLPGRER